MPTYLTPLVGAQFYPPAKLLLQWIPPLTPLILTPEPSNPYDPNAVQVFLDPKTLSKEPWLKDPDFLAALNGFGVTDDEELLASGLLQLGHLAAKTPRGSSTSEAAEWTYCNTLQAPIQALLAKGETPQAHFLLSLTSKWLVCTTLPEIQP